MVQLMPAERLVISVEEYALLLWRLAGAAQCLDPPPDSVVGVKRSGLFPAVFLSHQLELPLFTGAEAKSFPFPRLRLPLLTDTTAWTGESLRRIAARLEKCGAEARVLVMFARADPLPPLIGYTILKPRCVSRASGTRGLSPSGGLSRLPGPAMRRCCDAR